MVMNSVTRRPEPTPYSAIGFATAEYCVICGGKTQYLQFSPRTNNPAKS
jgi:hypothetical protein